MRLIRLTTENNNCFFENTYNSDLVIKPYSKVALSSFTTQLDNLNMVIDAQNNEISYSVDGPNNIKALTLPNGVYTSADVGNFWITTTKLFNASMSLKKNQINRQWRCSILGGRATFELKTGTRVYPRFTTDLGLQVFKNVVNGPVGYTFKQSPTAPAINNNCFMYIKSPVNKGCGVLRAKIYDDGSTFSNGFVLGYSAENPSITTTVINPMNYLYAIRYKDLSQPYGTIVNGVEIPSIVMPNIGDTLAIETYNNTLYFNIYPNGTNDDPITISSLEYDHTNDLFPLLLWVGAITVIGSIVFTSDPYYNITNTHTGEPINDNNLSIVPIPVNTPPTQCFLQFNSPDLATILGFDKSRYPDAGYNIEAEPLYQANHPFVLRDFSESYIVELLNIKLNSMDGMSNGNRSMLYVIPQLSAIKEHVVYQVPQLIFLDINNNFELNLREIKARVLKDDLTQFRCYGLSVLVLIVKEKDEI